jgi:organic radical activating enzyme
MLLPQLDKNQDVYIYGFGLAGKWLSLNLQANILGFIDTDYKKVGRTFNQYKVYSIDHAIKSNQKDCTIVVTVIDIQDVLSILQHIPHQNWIALGSHLNDTQANEAAIEESDEFVTYALKAVEDCHKGFLSKQELFLRSIDLVITEKCSLKCKDCSNLMQYYEAPVDITYDEVTQDFDDLTNAVDHIYEVRLIGGEPFMNKDIYKIIEYIVDSPKITKLVIYSNAMIPIKPSQAHIINHPKIVFSLTDYGELAKNTKRVTQSLDDLGIAYRLHEPENWTDSGVIHDFQRSVEQQKQLFSECCGKNLLTVSDGKLYRCPFAANADRLKAIPYNSANAVSVKASANEIRRYIAEIDYIPACNHCKGRSFGSPEIIPAIQAPNAIKYKKFEITVAKD